jgi:hypothetical protein
MNNDYTTINCLSKHDGKEVTLAGWLYKGRSSGSFGTAPAYASVLLKKAKFPKSFSPS